MVARTYSRPASDSAHNSPRLRRAPPAPRCCRSPPPKPGSTKPQFRPDAFQAIRPASSTATDQPPRAISRAVVRPARPAADHADIHIEIGRQRRASRRRHRGRGVPARRVVGSIGRAHVISLAGRAEFVPAAASRAHCAKLTHARLPRAKKSMLLRRHATDAAAPCQGREGRIRHARSRPPAQRARAQRRRADRRPIWCGTRCCPTGSWYRPHSARARPGSAWRRRFPPARRSTTRIACMKAAPRPSWPRSRPPIRPQSALLVIGHNPGSA